MKLYPFSKFRRNVCRFAVALLLLLILCAANCGQTAPVSPDPKDSLLVEARSLLNKGLATDAERVARAFLRDHQDSAEGHFLLGQILFKEIQEDSGKSADALRDEYHQSNELHAKNPFQDAVARASLAEFTEGAKYHAPSAFDLKIVALDYILLGAYSDADKWLSRSVEWDPSDEQAWYYLGRTKYNENRFEEAIHAFSESLRRNGDRVKVQTNLGLAYAGLGRTEEAIAAYKIAMAAQENSAAKDAGPYIDLGDLLLDQNRTEEALQYLRQANDIAPGNSKAHELLGKAYARLNQLVSARAELETAVRLAPQIASLHCMLGPIYRKQGLANEAKAEFEKCSSLSGPNSSSEKDHR